jgi:reactive intermediate/imine deaminase
LNNHRFELPGDPMKSISLKFLTLCLFFILAVVVPDGAGADGDSSDQASEPETQLPFSDAVRVGELLFLSGNIGVLPGTLDLAPGGIGNETRQTMENIKATLEKYGSSLGEVVKCTVYLADISDWPAMNEVYVEYFRVNPPARSALGANGLALGALTEIECIATVSD